MYQAKEDKMNKKLIIATTFLTSLTISAPPSFSQIQEAQGFGALIGQPTQRTVVPQRSNPVSQMQGMVSAWQNERDPSKKREIAIEIQKSLGVKADGIIGNQTLGAINQMGGMPPPISGEGQAGTSEEDFGGSKFRETNPAPTRGGFLAGLFEVRPAQTPQGQPGLSNMMNEWQNETDPNKKARLARQIQTRVGVKADGVIGNQTMKAIQQAGGMPGGGGMGGAGPAPQGGFGQPGMNPQGGFGQPGMHGGGGMPGGGGMGGPGPGGGDPGPGPGGGEPGPPPEN